MEIDAQRWRSMVACGLLLVSTVGMMDRAEAAAPVGACCQENGQCVNTTDTSCAEGGGIFAGIGVLCENVQCDPSVSAPVFSVVGFVGLFGALLGLGAFQIVRRR